MAPQPKSQPKLQHQHSSRNNQTKRQREWVYLSHYLAITGLNPLHIISGADDGHEPDFTLIFRRQSKLYYIGIELTTLPRLRDQMGDNGLIAKRWYWQSLLTVAKLRYQNLNYRRLDYQTLKPSRYKMPVYKVPVHTVYMPVDTFNKKYKGLPLSMITQADVDAVMQKKAHKVENYHTRRPLNELWLLIHTDKYQPNSILASPKPHKKRSNDFDINLYKTLQQPVLNNLSDTPFTHQSNFDQVHISRYPSHKLLNVSQKGTSS